MATSYAADRRVWFNDLRILPFRPVSDLLERGNASAELVQLGEDVVRVTSAHGHVGVGRDRRAVERAVVGQPRADHRIGVSWNHIAGFGRTHANVRLGQ